MGMLENIHYDMIIGWDLLDYLGIDIQFSKSCIMWDTMEIPLQSAHATITDSYYIEDSPKLLTSFDCVKEILDTKYKPADLDKVVKESMHLSKNEQEKLHKLLVKYEDLFDGLLGSWSGESYDIELKENITPFHSRVYPIPRVHEKTLKHKVK